MSEDLPLQELASRLAIDDRAVEAAYRRLAPSVLAYLRRVLPPHDAEDVLQRTFLDVWRNREQYDPQRPLAGWVMGIAKHRAADHARTRIPPPVDTTGEQQHGTDVDDDLAERFARSAEVRDALSRLTPEQRQVLVLAYFDDLSLPQIAEWLGTPLGTVKARAARGLRALGATLRRGTR